MEEDNGTPTEPVGFIEFTKTIARFICSIWAEILLVTIIASVIITVVTVVNRDCDRARAERATLYAYGAEWEQVKADHHCTIVGYAGKHPAAYYTCDDGMRLKNYRKAD
jgi:hypothetical protein